MKSPDLPEMTDVAHPRSHGMGDIKVIIFSAAKLCRALLHQYRDALWYINVPGLKEIVDTPRLLERPHVLIVSERCLVRCIASCRNKIKCGILKIDVGEQFVVRDLHQKALHMLMTRHSQYRSERRFDFVLSAMSHSDG